MKALRIRISRLWTIGLLCPLIGCVGARVPADADETGGDAESSSMTAAQGSATGQGSTGGHGSSSITSSGDAGTSADVTSGGVTSGGATSTSVGGTTWGGHEDSGTVCRPGAYQCEGADLLLCGPHGQSLQLVESCLTPEDCFAEAPGCRICEPGTFVCESANEVWSCDPSGTRLQAVDGCPDEQYCNVSENLCNPWVCPPFSFFCEGPALLHCFHDGSGFIDAGLWCDTGRCDAATQSCVHDDEGGETSETG